MMKTSTIVQLWLLVLLELVNIGCRAVTTCNVRPDFSNFSTPTTGSALSGTLYFDVNNPFTCYGILKQWRFCYKRSPGIQSDTLKIGLYQLQQNSYIKKSSNQINIQLKDSECLTVPADPQLVVEEGYVVAFIATSIYIKFYDDDAYGYLEKTVAFPNAVSKGIFIRTTNPYAPKLQGYVEELPATTSTTTTTTTTATNPSSSFLPTSSNFPPTSFPNFSSTSTASSNPIQPTVISISTMQSITTTNSESPNPSFERSRNVLAITYGTGLGSFALLLMILVLAMVIIKIKRTLKLKRDINEDRYMAYNVNYIPSRPDQIIIENRKELLKFKENPSYAAASSSDLGALPRTAGQLEHIYESLES